MSPAAEGAPAIGAPPPMGGLIDGAPDARVGNGYAPPEAAAAGGRNARWADLGMSATTTWPDAGGLASALTNAELISRADELVDEAARALNRAAYLRDLRRYRLTEAARELGRQAGLSAGAWAADGNTNADAARRVIALSEAGDDISDYLPRRPGLSGEWADARTPQALARELGLLDELDAEDYELIDELSNAYEDGVSLTFEDACLSWIRAAAR